MLQFTDFPMLWKSCQSEPYFLVIAATITIILYHCLHCLLIARMDGEIIFNDVFAMKEMLNKKLIF